MRQRPRAQRGHDACQEFRQRRAIGVRIQRQRKSTDKQAHDRARDRIAHITAEESGGRHRRQAVGSPGEPLVERRRTRAQFAQRGGSHAWTDLAGQHAPLDAFHRVQSPKVGGTRIHAHVHHALPVQRTERQRQEGGQTEHGRWNAQPRATARHLLLQTVRRRAEAMQVARQFHQKALGIGQRAVIGRGLRHVGGAFHRHGVWAGSGVCIKMQFVRAKRRV